jgi:hypothetical protein
MPLWTTTAKSLCLLDPAVCREEHDAPAPPDAETVEEDETEAETGRGILCRSCRQLITARQHETTVNGQHQHTFFNPAGIVFEISCYRQADGCVVRGQPTDEFTWFAGYDWQYSLCATCGMHMGWFFRSRDSFFFGLISSKLIADS